ncbi:MAG: hypothetical protein Q9169_001046 [Polycauliona sp. 2 TL-2023]
MPVSLGNAFAIDPVEKPVQKRHRKEGPSRPQQNARRQAEREKAPSPAVREMDQPFGTSTANEVASADKSTTSEETIISNNTSSADRSIAPDGITAWPGTTILSETTSPNEMPNSNEDDSPNQPATSNEMPTVNDRADDTEQENIKLEYADHGGIIRFANEMVDDGEWFE